MLEPDFFTKQKPEIDCKIILYSEMKNLQKKSAIQREKKVIEN